MRGRFNFKEKKGNSFPAVRAASRKRKLRTPDSLGWIHKRRQKRKEGRSSGNKVKGKKIAR